MKNCSIIDLCTPLLLNIQAYRVRFVETELPKNKRMSISEYGYNPNSKTRGRYNKPGEHVLYTSTNPSTSYNETIPFNSLSSPFYLSVWRKRDEEQTCSCFLSSFESSSENIRSNAGKIKMEYVKNLNQEKKIKVRILGEILEKKYLQDDEDKYKESSELASCIFKYADCIISPSAKEPEEINITFNKEFTDNSLILDRVYFCSPFDIQQNSLVFRVDKIGLVIDNRVVWHKWHVKENELADMNSNRLVHYINNTGSFIYPNINKQINDWHCGYYNNKCVKFKIEMEVEND